MTLETVAQTVTFLCPRYPQMHMVRVPIISHIDYAGRRHQDEAGLSYDFKDGVLELSVGQDVRPDGPGGEERDALTWMRSHPDYGSLIHENVEPQPPADEYLREVNRATAGLDDVTLQELIVLEEEGFKRENLLSVARDALALVLETQASSGDGALDPVPE